MLSSMQPYEGCKGISFTLLFYNNRSIWLFQIFLFIFLAKWVMILCMHMCVSVSNWSACIFSKVYNFKHLSNYFIFSNFNINFHFDIIKFRTLWYIFLESSIYALFKNITLIKLWEISTLDHRTMYFTANCLKELTNTFLL